MNMMHSSISLEKVETDDKKLKDVIERQNTPWFKRKSVKKVVVLLMICSEATALVATIIAFNNTLSPLFTAPITVIYCIAFVLLGFFQAKTLGAYLIGDESISKKRLIAGLIINGTLVCLPIITVGDLRWVTRELGQRLTEEAAAVTATPEENAFGMIMILLPLLIYLCEVYMVTAEVLYDHREHPLFVSSGQYEDLLRIRDEMKVLYEGMPSEEERREELLRNDEEQYVAAVELVKSLGQETVVDAIYELMKAKRMDADDVSRMTASMYKEVTGHDAFEKENDDRNDYGSYGKYDDALDRLRVG